MTERKPKSTPKRIAADTSAAVDALMAKLDHPHAAGIAALRKIVCEADPSVEEGVKWNAPSFRTHEYFATTHLRVKEGFGLVLHLGAKVCKGAKVEIEDPEGLLRWLAEDRAMVTFRDAKELRARKRALLAILRQWVRHV